MTQTTNTLPYSIPKLDMSQIGNYNSLRVIVEGFWYDVIDITIRRVGYDHTKQSNWSFSVSHSYGGFETDYDNLQATINFGLANIAAAEYCRELMTRVDEIEAAYVSLTAIAIAEREEELRIAQEKVDADPAVGEDIAKANIKKMIADFEDGKMPTLSVRKRAQENVLTIKPTYKGQFIRFDINGGLYTRKDIIEYLAGMSLASLSYVYAA